MFFSFRCHRIFQKEIWEAPTLYLVTISQAMSHIWKFNTQLPAEGAGDIEIILAMWKYKEFEMKKKENISYLIFRMVGQVCVSGLAVEYLVGESLSLYLCTTTVPTPLTLLNPWQCCVCWPVCGLIVSRVARKHFVPSTPPPQTLYGPRSATIHLSPSKEVWH